MTLGGVCCVASSFPCGALKKQISEMVFCSRVIITGFSHFARNPAKIRKSAFLGTAARSTEFVPRISLVQKTERPWKRGCKKYTQCRRPLPFHSWASLVPSFKNANTQQHRLDSRIPVHLFTRDYDTLSDAPSLSILGQVLCLL